MVPRSFLLFLLGILPGLALPDVEESRRVLGSPDFEQREALTLELWESGPKALPLLKALAGDPHPEVATRASFVLHRINMGLGPQAPGDLLLLAELADQAAPKSRSARLGDLLGHEAGYPVALFFLNQWLSNRQTPAEDRISLTETCLEALLDDRSRWRDLLTYAFSPDARAMLIGALCIQEMPRKETMIALLAATDLREVHRALAKNFPLLPAATHHTLARLAILRGDLALALETLSQQLATAENPESARAIAFLEHTAGLAPTPYQGPWLDTLQLFRARARMDDRATLEFAGADEIDPFLAYESRLLAGVPSIPEGFPDADSPLLPAWHLAFGAPPGDPDPEALTSSVLADWPALARTLTALARPLEAAERLAAEGHPDSAINLLWRTGHRRAAQQMTEAILADLDPEFHLPVRLTMASLHLQEGERDKAITFFRPLLVEGISDPTRRARAIRLARKFLPLGELVLLEPHLTSTRPFQRDRAVTSFFDLPPQVASFWYEEFRRKTSSALPHELIEKIERFLADERVEARRVIAERIVEEPGKLLLPGDPLYQNALFLQTPQALDMVIRAAWHQLSTLDLRAIIRSEAWPPDQKRKALATALTLDPADPVLRWFDLTINDTGNPDTILLASLGDPALALQIGQLTGKRESLSTTTRLASLKDPATLRGLGILGRSHLKEGDPETAARLLRSALLGGIAMGTRPAPSIPELLENLEALYQARHLTAPTEATRQLWTQRLAGIGAEPLATE